MRAVDIKSCSFTMKFWSEAYFCKFANVIFVYGNLKIIDFENEPEKYGRI